MGEIREKRMYSFNNTVGATVNTASAFPPIFTGACVFPEGDDLDRTFLSLPTLATVTERLGYKTQTFSAQQTTSTAIYYHEALLS
jgi:hypothetical protein